MSEDDRGPVSTPARGCNPLVFGVVMATLEMGAVMWLMYCR